MRLIDEFFDNAEIILASTNEQVKEAQDLMAELRAEGLLTPEPFDESIEFLAFEGKGTLAVSLARAPLSLDVTRDMPVSVPVASVVAWSGDLSAQIADSAELVAGMPSAGGSGPLIRIEGAGTVFTEPPGK